MAGSTKKGVNRSSRPILFIHAGKPAGRRFASAMQKAGFELVEISLQGKILKEDLGHSWDAILVADDSAKGIGLAREKRGLQQIPIALVYTKRIKSRLADPLMNADDYIRLPATTAELTARVNAVIERGRRNLDAYILKKGSKTLEQILDHVRGEKSDLEVLQRAASEISKIYPNSRCTIIMIDQDRDHAVVVAETRNDKELNIALDLKNYPEIRKVLETRKPLAISDVQRHPLMREVREILATKSIQSLLLVPVIYKEELIGIIFLRSLLARQKYTTIDVFFSRIVSDLLAIALKNLRLARRAEVETKEKEEAIHKARYSGAVSKRLEKLFEYASDGLIIINEQGRTTGVNLNFIRLSGYERGELIGRTITGLLEFEKPREEKLTDWVKSKHRSGSSNLLLKLKTGAQKFVTAHIELLPGTRKEWLISVHDVTEERKLNMELARTKEFLENLIENSMETIIAADVNGKIIIFNKAAERLTGYKAAEVLNNKNIVDLYAPSAARAVMKKLRSPFYGGPGRLETTHNVLISKTGEEIPINMSASIIYGHDGQPLATMGLYQDIRERIEIEKRLRQAQERLLESRRKETVMALAGATAHELNQPLTSIMGYAEILKRAEDQIRHKVKIGDRAFSPIKNAVKIISDQAERMAEVIKKLGGLTEFETLEYTGKQRIMDLERGDRMEKTLELALSVVDEAVVLMDDELVILSSYGRAKDLFGEKPDGKSLSRYLEGVNFATGTKLVEEAKTRDSAEEELELCSADGKFRRVLAHVEKAGEKKLIMVISDVDQLRQMQNQLKELVAFRGQLFQTMPVPLIVLDEDGRITHFSKEAEKLFGWTFEELKGKPPSMMLEDFEPGKFVGYLREVRQRGIVEGTFRARDKAGRVFEIYYSFGAMRDPGGNIVGYLAFMVDLSEKQLLEQALREKTAFLETIQKNTALLVQSSDWQEALTSMLSEMHKLFEYDVALVVTGEQAERGYYFFSYYPASGEKRFEEQRTFEQLDRALNWLGSPEIKYCKDLSQVDYSHAPGDIKEAIPELLKRGIVNFVSIPLRFQDEVIGRLFFGHHEPGHLQEEQHEPVKQLIEQITIAVSHFRLEKQRLRLIQHNLFLERILEQSQKPDFRKDEAQIFASFLNLFQDIFPRAHLWLAWKTAGDSFAIRGVSNLSPELIGRELKISEEVRGKIISGGQPTHLEPGTEMTGFLEDCRDLILTPIIAESSLIGLMGVESHHKEPYLAEKEFLLQLFSRYMAVLIPNLVRIRSSVRLKSFQDSLIESTDAFILMIGESRIHIFNRAFEEKLGITKENLHGVTAEQFIDKHIVQVQEERGKSMPVAEILMNVFKGQKYSNLRVRFRSMNGELFEALFNIAGLRDEAGKMLGLICVGQDLSPIRELESHLLHYERLAGLGQMAAGVVHELNNPLQAIITYSELVKHRLDEIGETDMSRRLTNVIDAGERVRRLSRNLISYARPSTEVVEEINLKSLVDESLSFSSYELSRGGVTIKNEVSETLPRIKAVKDQVEQVLINLVTNASQACEGKHGGLVRIGGAIDGEWLELKVEDNGVGIKPEQVSRIFEPFFTTKPGGKGTGLGLNIVKSIVERHNGKIDVSSKYGEGTTFTVRFPLAAQ